MPDTIEIDGKNYEVARYVMRDGKKYALLRTGRKFDPYYPWSGEELAWKEVEEKK